MAQLIRRSTLIQTSNKLTTNFQPLFSASSSSSSLRHRHSRSLFTTATSSSTTTTTASSSTTTRTRPTTSLFTRIALMSTLAAASLGSAAYAETLAPPAPAAPTVSATASYTPPEPTVWDRVRSIWIPTSAAALYEAEQKIFSNIEYPYTAGLVATPAPDIMQPTKEGEKPVEWHINTLTIRNPSAKLPASSTPSVVVIHGFGAGIGLSISNFNQLATTFPRTDYIDLLGWGRSDRVDFETYLERRIKAEKITKKPAKGQSKEDAEIQYNKRVASIAADFSVDSLEAWRIAQGHEKMIIVGHSMGGFASAAYALKYPDRVASLILASPIGVPVATPLNLSARMGWLGRRVLATARWAWWSQGITPQSIVRALGRLGPKPVNGYVTRRFANSEEELDARDATTRAVRQEIEEEEKQAAASGAEGSASATSSASAFMRVGREARDKTPSPTRSSTSPDLAVGEEKRRGSASEAGPTLELDDTLGALGKLQIKENESAAAAAAASSSSSSPSSINLAPTQLFNKSVVADYLYHICAAPGSGEFAFARLFDTSGFAYNPLIESLPRISKGRDASSSSSSSSPRVPITFLYGSHDWMDVNAGRATAAIINAQGGSAQVLEVPRAGHQLMIDNPAGFLKVVEKATKLR